MRGRQGQRGRSPEALSCVAPPYPSLAAMAGARGQSHGLIDNFFLTDEELENSPSRRAGVDAETEHRLRVFGCELIQLGVLHMRAPQAVAATGQVLLQRFYCKESLMKYDVKVRRGDHAVVCCLR